MLYIKIPKDLREYKQKVFFGRTAQELFWIGLALAAGSITFAICYFTVGTQVGSYATMGVSLPLFFCGFITIQDMSALEYIKKIVNYYRRNLRLLYDNSYIYDNKVKNLKSKKHKKMLKQLHEEM